MVMFSPRRLRSKSRASNASSALPDAPTITVKQEQITVKTEPGLFVDNNVAVSSRSRKRKVTTVKGEKLEVEEEIASLEVAAEEESNTVQPVIKKRKYVRKQKVKVEPAVATDPADDVFTSLPTTINTAMAPPIHIHHDALAKGKGKGKAVDMMKQDYTISHECGNAMAGSSQAVDQVKKAKGKAKTLEEKGEKRGKR